jgi:hypothetical protein
MQRSGSYMNNGLGKGSSPTPFEPVRDAYRLHIPPAALERLCDLAQVHAHFRPTFANAMRELLAKSHRWHRMASRSVEMDAVAKELGQVVKDARKLKEDIDKLSPQARMTLGLYALRLDKFSELDPHEAARNQIEDLVNLGGSGQAGPKVGQLSWAAGRIESAAATETWPKPKSGGLAPWKIGGNPNTPFIETFDRFVIELSKAVQACNSPLQFDPNNISSDLTAFLEAAAAHLPSGFVPDEVFHPEENGKAAGDSRMKKLTAFWSKTP